MDEELMPVVWHPTRWWDWCFSEDMKKEIDPILTDKLGKCYKRWCKAMRNCESWWKW